MNSPSKNIISSKKFLHWKSLANNTTGLLPAFFLHGRLCFMSYEQSFSQLNIQVSSKKSGWPLKRDGHCGEVPLVEVPP